MLRITPQTDAAAARSYFTASDYFLDGQELPGVWGGKGAELLGLEGTVAKRDFDRLCDNLHPKSGDRLTQRTRDDRTIGYDFTWSVPKSVSLLYALSKDEAILDAFRQAVDETMQDLEAEMKVRVRKRGQDSERKTGNAVWASFYHFTSRPIGGIPDPQLHAHAFVFNNSFDREEDIWKAGQFRDLKRDAPYWQALMRSRLANRLQDLGFAIERKRDDFEIKGIGDNTLLKKFSRRTAAIEAVAAKRGITDAERKAQLGAETREGKNKQLTWPQLQAEWKQRLSPAEAEKLEQAARPRSPESVTGRLTGGEKAAVDYALLHCFERQAVVPERGLLTEAIRHGIGVVTPEGVAKELARRKLVIREVGGERLATSPAILAEEQRVVAFAKDGRGAFAPLVGFDRKIARAALNEQQRQAVCHLWQSSDRVMLLRGAAGTGKTTLLQEAVEGIEAAGHHVVAFAQSAAASRGALREAGISDADTIARFLKDENMQQRVRPGDVVLIDEASLVGTPTLARLFAIAEQREARVILVGDTRQHGAIERGQAFQLIQERAAVPVVEVTEIQRQKNRQYKDAVRALSEGRTLDGFNVLDGMGWVEEAADQSRDKKLAQDYVKAMEERKPGQEPPSVLIVSPTHAEIARITAAVREELKAAGKLGEERSFAVWTPASLTEAERSDASNLSPGDMLQFHQHIPGHKSGERLIVREGEELPPAYANRFQVYRPAELKVAVGDRIRVTANGKTKDGRHRLENGSLFKVKGFTKAGDIIVDKNWVIGREFGQIAHGFAVTSFASQGKSVDRVWLAQSSLSFPASSKQQFYVSASRAKWNLKIYTDSKAALREAIRRSDPRMSALDLVTPARQEIRPAWKRHLAFMHRLATMAAPRRSDRSVPESALAKKELAYER